MIHSPIHRMFGVVWTAALVLVWRPAGAVEFYWTGDISSSWSTNVAGNTNWATTLAGTTDPGALPTATSDLYFSKTGGVPTGTLTLDGAFSVNSLTFNSQQPGALLIAAGSGGGLTIGAGGLTVDAASSDHAISTSLALGTNQAWNIGANRALTVSGAIGGSANLTKSGAGTLVLSGDSNGYTGVTTVNAGTLQLSGANGAIASSAFNLNNATLLVDNTGSASNNNSRLADSAILALNNASFVYRGADAAATNSTETLGSLSLGAVSSSTVTVAFGGINTATLTAGSITRTTGQGTLFVNGQNLGRNATSTASVGRILVSSSPALIGTTEPLASGINASAQDTKIVPFLVGEAAAVSGGLGTASGVANTFVTYQSGTGLRPLNPINEFAQNVINSGKNTRITAPTAATGPTSINSLIVAGGDLSINGTVNLNIASGAVLFGTSNAIKPSAVNGRLDFGTAEGIITSNAGVIATISAAISGSAGLTKSGAGTLMLSGANTFVASGAGGVNVTGGTLSINADAALGNANNALTINGLNTTLQATGNWNPGSTRTITVGTGGVALDIAAGTTTTLDDAGQLVMSSGQLTKAGPGTLTLSAVQRFTTTGAAGINITGGVLSANADDALGNANNAIAINGAGATLQVTGDWNPGLGRVITIGASGGTLDVSNRIVNSQLVTTVVTFDDIGQLAVAGGRLTKTGDGTLQLVTTNTFVTSGADGINITGGALSINADGALGNAANDLTISGTGATLRLTSDWNPGSGRVVTIGPSGGTLDVGVSATATIDDDIEQLAISGGQLTKAGGGTLVLSTANTFTTTGPAGINITGGVFSINADTALGNLSNSVTINGTGAALQLTGDWNPGSGRTLTIGSGGGTLDVAASKTATIDDADQLLVVSGGQITKAGPGTLVLTKTNTFITAGINVTAGVLSINADGALGDADNDLTINGAGATLSLTGNWIPDGTRVVTIGPGGGTLDVAVGTTATLDDDNQLAGTSGQFTKAGSGALVLARPNSLTTSGPAGINVTAGMLSINNDNVLGNVNNDLTLDNGAVLATTADVDFNAGRVLTANAAGATIDVATGTTLTIDDANQLSLTGPLTKTGSGAITIRQAQFGAGGFRLHDGTVRIGTSDVFGTGALALSGGTVTTTAGGIGGNRTVGNNLLLNGGVTFGDASFSGYTLTFNGTTQTVDNSATITSTNHSGLSFTTNPLGLNTGFTVNTGVTPADVTFSGGLTVNGAVAGANRTITLNNGAAAVTISGPLAGTAANQTITLAGTGTNNTIGAVTSGANTPGLIVNGSPTGVFLFTTQNTFSGGVTLSGGIAEVTLDTTGAVTNGPFGTGTLAINGGTLRPGLAADRTLSNPLAITGGTSTLAASTANGRQLTLSGPVTISGNPTLVFANDAARNFTYTHATNPALTANSSFTLVGNNAGGVNWGTTGSIFSLNGNVAVSMNDTGNIVFSTGGRGRLNLNGASRTFTIDGTRTGAFQFVTPGVLTATATGLDLVLAGSSANTTVGSFLSDATGNNKTPRITVNSATGGTFTFNGGSGTYPGGTLLAAGTLVVANNSTVTSGAISSGPLGTGTLSIQGGAIRANTTARTINNSLAVIGDFAVAAGGQLLTVNPTTVTSPVAGTITLAGARTITANSNLALTGVISGTSTPSLTKSGPADLVLIGGGTASTFGNLRISQGRVIYDSQNTLGTGTTIIVADGASLVKNSNVGALTLNQNTTTINVGANISNRSGAATPTLTLPTANVQFPSGGRVLFNFDDQATAAIALTGNWPGLSANLVLQNGGNNLTVGGVTIPDVPLGGVDRTLAFDGPGTVTISGQTLSAKLTVAGNASSGFTGLVPSGGGPVFGSGLSQTGTRAITMALAPTGVATLPATSTGWTGGTIVRSGILAEDGGNTSGKKVGGGTVLLDGGFLRNASGANNDATYTDSITVSASGGGLETFSSGNTQNVTFSGDISGSGPLTLRYGGSGSNNSTLTLSGNNSTFAGGFTLATTNGAGRVQFTGVNSTVAAGNTITVPGGVAFGFDSFATLTTPGVLGKFVTSPDSILVVDNYGSSSIDLSSAGLNRNVRIGSAGNLTFSGTLVPFGGNYNLTPTSGQTLTFSGTNQFTGSGNLDVRAGAIVPDAGAAATGTLVISAANDLSGTTTVSGIINNSLLGKGLTGTTFNLSDSGKLSATSALTVSRGAQVSLTGAGTTGQGQLGGAGVAIKISGGGSLRLGTTTATNNDGVTDRVNSTGSLTLGDTSEGGGTLTLALASVGTHSQMLDSLTVARGGSVVNSVNPVAGTTTLTFGGANTANYNRQAGGRVNFTIPTSMTNAVSYAAGATTISGVTSTNIAKGMPISGSGIAAGTYVADFTGGTITLSRPTVTSGLSAALTYVVNNEQIAFTNIPATTSVKGGILIGATINGAELVEADAGNIGLPSYTTDNNQAHWGGDGTTGNVQTTGTLSGTVSNSTINALRIAGNSTVTINTLNTLTIDSGMLLVAPVVSTGVAVNGGALLSGNGQDLMVVNGSGQTVTIGSALSGGLPLTYASSGGGALTLSNAANANAGLNAIGGTIKIGSANAWGNPGQLFLDGGNIEYTAAADKSLMGGYGLIVTPNGGNLWHSSGNNTLTLADAITLNGALGVHGNNGSGKGTLAFNGTISGPGQIGLGAGGSSGAKFTLVLGGDNAAWSGGIRVDSSQFGSGGSGTRRIRVMSADGLGTGSVVLSSDGLAAFTFAYNAGPATYSNAFLLNQSAPLIFWGLGPGLSTSGGTAVTTLSGKISGLSGLNFQGYATADNQISELVLSGTVSTAGTPVSYSYGTATAAKNFNNAPGGITLGVTDLRGTTTVANESLIDLPVGTATNGAEGFLRFSGANSLIPGAVGNGYVAALRKAGTGGNGRFGIMLTGGGAPYQLPEGKSFVIGSLGSGSQVGGTFGATGIGVNTAMLIGSPWLAGERTGTINIHADGQSDTQSLNLLARNLGDTLVLGQAGNAVVFTPTCGDSGAAVAPSYTLMQDRTRITTLNKVGNGTVEIANVEYNNLSGASVRDKFIWNVNAGTLRYSQNDGAAANLLGFNVNEEGILAVTGKINAPVNVNVGGTLALGGAGDVAIGDESLSIQGSGANDVGALENRQGNNSWGGTVSLLNDAIINVATGSLDLTAGLANNSTGAGHVLMKIGSGTLIISGPQHYGPGAVLQIGSSSNNSKLWVGGTRPTGSLQTTSVTQAFGRVMKNSAQSATITLNSNGSDAATTNASIVASGDATTTTGNPIVDFGTVATVNAGLNTAATGTRSGTVTITNLAGSSAFTGQGSDNGAARINVNGTVLDNREVTATYVDFGTLHVGVSRTGSTTLSTASGDDNHATHVRVGNAGPNTNGIGVSGGTNPLFDANTVTDVRTVGGTFSVPGQKNTSIILTTVGEGLPYESPINVSVYYTAQVYSGQSGWKALGDGSWGNNSNWEDSVTSTISAAPGTWGVNGDTATFGNVIGSSPVTVALDGANPSLAALIFNNNAPGYKVAQGTGGTLTLAGTGSGNASVLVQAGNHSIFSPVALASNTTLTVANIIDRLTVAGPLTVSSSAILTKIGAGTLVISGPQNYGLGAVLQIGGSGGFAPMPAGVPEPGTLALLVAGVLAWLIIRPLRRKAD